MFCSHLVKRSLEYKLSKGYSRTMSGESLGSMSAGGGWSCETLQKGIAECAGIAGLDLDETKKKQAPPTGGWVVQVCIMYISAC